MDNTIKKEPEGRLREVYAFIRSYSLSHGFSPSVREIGEALGIRSTSTVHAALKQLEALGYLVRDPARPRAMVAADTSGADAVLSLPRYSRASSEEELFTPGNIEEYLPLPSSFVRDENAFVLTAEGSAMSGAGISDGDLLVIRKQSFADDGDLMAVIIPREGICVRRFYLENRRVIRLHAENPGWEDIYLPAQDVKILGKVSGLLRRLR